MKTRHNSERLQAVCQICFCGLPRNQDMSLCFTTVRQRGKLKIAEHHPALPPVFRFRAIWAAGLRAGKHQIKFTPFNVSVQKSHIAACRKAIALQVGTSMKTLTGRLRTETTNNSVVLIRVALAGSSLVLR